MGNAFVHNIMVVGWVYSVLCVVLCCIDGASERMGERVCMAAASEQAESYKSFVKCKGRERRR